MEKQAPQKFTSSVINRNVEINPNQIVRVIYVGTQYIDINCHAILF